MSYKTSRLIPEICIGCLAIDRRLTKLGKYLDIYHRLSATSQAVTYKSDFKDWSTCWECRTTIIKICKFQEKIREAQKLLTMKVDCKKKRAKLKCLSSLTTFVKSDYDFKIIDERKVSIQQDIKTLFKNEYEGSLINGTSFSNLEDEEIKSEEHAETNDDRFEILEDDIKDEYLKYEELGEGNFLDFESFSNQVFEVSKDKADTVAVHKSDGTLKCKKRNKPFLKRKLKFKYRLTFAEDLEEESKVRKIRFVDLNELLDWRKKERNLLDYTKSKYKCECCISPFPSEEALIYHMEKLHSKKNTEFECEVCGQRFQCESEMVAHNETHYFKCQCTLCNFVAYKEAQLLYHFDNMHKKMFECRTCKMRFGKITEFNSHYKGLHAKYTCDYCGKDFKSRNIFKNHLKKRHADFICKQCHITYQTYDGYQYHLKLRHVVKPTEESYCVECNKQFDNMLQYNRHLRKSTKHQFKRYPCTECDKVYTKKWYRTNHYRHKHLQQTDYFCDKCSKNFLNGFRLRQHIASVHEKVARPKNKICVYCGRGFTDKRILENHIRTHTGERPFACTYCQAAFTQKYPLTIHLKKVHQKEKDNL